MNEEGDAANLQSSCKRLTSTKNVTKTGETENRPEQATNNLIFYMNVQEQIKKYIGGQPELKDINSNVFEEAIRYGLENK
jgi:hypothetical protein